MRRVYVVRHGETQWNREGRYQGQRESELSELGRRQADALAVDLSSSDAGRVVASPLARCTQTAAAIARALHLRVQTDPRLIEIAHGTWEGRLRSEIERDEPQRMREWREDPQLVRFEGGESLGDVDTRWRRFAASLPGDTNAIVVTHDVVVRLAILNAMRAPLADLWKPRVENGGYALF
ncbi:MAG TPA: histidine phosphatase family protein, partial [Candidatus Baltobacteraceae bacterium]|nr:histidine phosphatase family protein [Candidatus Baltobacteraceae bacterium]